MLDPKLLRTEIVRVAENLAKRGYKLDIDRYKSLESSRKTLQVRLETLQAERNAKSKAIGKAKSSGEDVDALKQEVGNIGETLKSTSSHGFILLSRSTCWMSSLSDCATRSMSVG